MGAVNVKLYKDLHTPAGKMEARAFQDEFVSLQNAKNAPPADQRRIGHTIEFPAHFPNRGEWILAHEAKNAGVQIGGGRFGIAEEWCSGFVPKGSGTIECINDGQPGYFPAFFFG
jgi:hypothetical protein